MNNQNLFNLTNIKEKLRYLKKIITIEPIICFYIIATNMRSPTVNNLLLEMACRVNEGFNDTVCHAIITSTHVQENFTTENSAVQEHISKMLSWCYPVQSIIPVILLLFLGTYSDCHKIRKPFIVIPIFGEFFSIACCLLCVIFKEKWPVETVGIAKYVISALFGSWPMINMAAFAYIADVSTPEMRIIRLAILQICFNICNPIGMAISGLLFNVIGYISSLLLCLVILVVALFYGVLIVKEPKQCKEDTNIRHLISDIINLQHAKETLKLLTKSTRTQLVHIIFIMCIDFIFVAVGSGEKSVLFWFTQQAYKWKNTDFAFFVAARSIINSVALTVSVPLFLKVFHLHDLTIIAVSFLNKIIANIICLTIKTSSGLYIASAVGMLTTLASSGIRSQSTKCVSEDDMGKTQSLLLIIEAIAASIATQIYNQGIYSHTRETYSQAFFFIGIALYALGLIVIVLWKYVIGRKQLSNEESVAEYKQNFENTIL